MVRYRRGPSGDDPDGGDRATLTAFEERRIREPAREERDRSLFDLVEQVLDVFGGRRFGVARPTLHDRRDIVAARRLPNRPRRKRIDVLEFDDLARLGSYPPISDAPPSLRHISALYPG